MRPEASRSEQLVATASALLDAEGPHALTLRRLAEAVGTSTQAVYTEFGGKPGLADALFRLGYRRLAARLDSVESIDDPIEHIVALGTAYRSAARAHPAHYELMTARPIAEYEPPRSSLADAAATMQPLVDAVGTAVSSGLIDGDPATVARDLWAAGHGYVSLELTGLIPADDVQFDRYLRERLRTLVRQP